MDQMRKLHKDAPQPLRGPHQGGVLFKPLRLRREPGGECVLLQRPRVLIGRHSGVDVRLADVEVSRRHCVLLFENGQWRVQDLDSLNGVFVNERRCREGVLVEGDRLRLGAVVFVVEGSSLERTRRAMSQQVLQQIVDHIPLPTDATV